jgi:hypothetical protein
LISPSKEKNPGDEAGKALGQEELGALKQLRVTEM